MSVRKRQKGFTLIEAIVAIAVMAIASAFIISIFSNGALQSSARVETYGLYSEAQSRLTLLSAELAAGAGDLEQRGSNGAYSWTTRATTIFPQAGDSRRAELVEAAVEVSIAARNRPHTVILITYVERAAAL